MKTADYTGKRFGKRVVIERAGQRGYRSLWRVRCDCGYEVVCLAQTLRCTQRCKQCSHKGPRLNRRKRPFEALYNSLLQRARHPVRLSYEEFVAFTAIKECHYCGAELAWNAHRKTGIGSPSNLDRKDSDGAYEVSNVVVCCLRCNKAKNRHFSYDEWSQLGAVIRSWREQK